MVEEQNVAGGRRGPPVELSAATRRPLDDDRTGAAGRLDRSVATSAVGDDELVAERDQAGQSLAQRASFVEDRDHDREAEIHRGKWNASIGIDPTTAEPGRSWRPPFSHLDAQGAARMVDISGKSVTRRIAEASCRVSLSPQTVARLSAMPKGDALAVARLAGIQAAKRTAEWVPLAHTLPLEHVDVEIEPAGVAFGSRAGSW